MIVKNLEKKEKSTVSFDVVCGAEEFERAVNGVYLKNKKSIFVQGFRKGKAPRMVIEGLYGKDVFYEDAADALAPEAFRFGAEQEGLRTVGTPGISDWQVSDGKELTLSFLTAVWPEVTLGQYRGVEAPRAAVEITDGQVDDEIERVRRRNARIVSVERPAKDGDTAVIDYVGTVDGVPFDGGADEDHGLMLGSGTFIPGFEEQVVGMVPGQEKDLQVTFPEDYHEPSLSGKDAVFHVTLKELKEELLPEIDDEFVKDVSEFDTLEEYKNDVRERLRSAAEEEAEAAFKDALIERAGDAITADIPDAMVQGQIDSILREYDQGLQANGLNLELYLKYLGQDLRSFRESCRPTAERRVKTELLLDKIAEEENIEVSAEDIEAEYEKFAEQYGEELDAVKSGVPESAVISDIKARRAAQIIFDTGVPTEPEPEPEEDEAPAADETAEKAGTGEEKSETETGEKTEE